MAKDNSIIEELERIAKQNDGILQPEIVVEEARRPSSPLHSKFTWDDTEAAHQYRLYQARTLIRVVVQMIPNTADSHERVWVSLKKDRITEGGGYRTLVSVLSDNDLREQLLQQALEDMTYFQEKYTHLQELSEVFSAIRTVRVKIKKSLDKQDRSVQAR